MRVAVWDDFPIALFTGRDVGGRAVLEFEAVPRLRAVEVLESGGFDAVLISTLDAIRMNDVFDVYPAVALSSWDFPYAQLALSGSLDQRVSGLTYESGYELEALVARVVLREHYGYEVEVRGMPLSEPEALMASAQDAAVVVAPDAYRIEPERFKMDLGREWFELVNYPMVWGLFAGLKGTISPESIVALRDAVAWADDDRAALASAQEDDVLSQFIGSHVRLRLDDLAVASLTELYNYVYYYGVVEDYHTIPFVSLSEEEGSESDRAPQL